MARYIWVVTKLVQYVAHAGLEELQENNKIQATFLHTNKTGRYNKNAATAQSSYRGNANLSLDQQLRFGKIF